MSFADDLKTQLKKAARQGVRDGLGPGIAYGLKLMYADYYQSVSGVEVDWDRQANRLLDHMRDHAKAKKAGK